MPDRLTWRAVAATIFMIATLVLYAAWSIEIGRAHV